MKRHLFLTFVAATLFAGISADALSSEQVKFWTSPYWCKKLAGSQEETNLAANATYCILPIQADMGACDGLRNISSESWKDFMQYHTDPRYEDFIKKFSANSCGGEDGRKLFLDSQLDRKESMSGVSAGLDESVCDPLKNRNGIGNCDEFAQIDYYIKACGASLCARTGGHVGDQSAGAEVQTLGSGQGHVSDSSGARPQVPSESETQAPSGALDQSHSSPSQAASLASPSAAATYSPPQPNEESGAEKNVTASPLTSNPVRRDGANTDNPFPTQHRANAAAINQRSDCRLTSEQAETESKILSGTASPEQLISGVIDHLGRSYDGCYGYADPHAYDETPKPHASDQRAAIANPFLDNQQTTANEPSDPTIAAKLLAAARRLRESLFTHSKSGTPSFSRFQRCLIESNNNSRNGSQSEDLDGPLMLNIPPCIKALTTVTTAPGVAGNAMDMIDLQTRDADKVNLDK